ncbi:hypothetical protein ACJRO7_023143 [Eucalyptus globulus]|uniref:Uncharacterized protein n=1 Tax=Eucalyptus globulus TaxID=34317 RepID=A0ABD3K0T2_EUCGL
MDALEMNVRMVSARKADFKKRKKEVELWMRSVGSLEEQVHDLGRKVKAGHFFSHLMLKDRVSGLAIEVEKLNEKGKFDNGLTLNLKPAHGYELQLRELVRQASFCRSLRMLSRLRFKPPSWLSLTLMELRQLRQIRWPGSGRLDSACQVTSSQEDIVG